MAGLVAQRLRAARHLILFATFMAFAAGVIAFLRYDISVRGLPLPIFTGLVYASLVGTAVTVTSVALPALAAFVEATAISRLVAAIAAIAMPEFGHAMQTSPFPGATVVVAGAIVIRKLTTLVTARRPALLGLLPSQRIAA